jgi:hypothetical protein
MVNWKNLQRKPVQKRREAVRIQMELTVPDLTKLLNPTDFKKVFLLITTRH